MRRPRRARRTGGSAQDPPRATKMAQLHSPKAYPPKPILSGGDDAHALEHADDALGALLRRERRRVEHQLGGLRRLVGRIDAGEVLDLAAPRLPVEPLRIAALREAERRVDEHL